MTDVRTEEMAVRWSIRTTPEQRMFEHWIRPNTFDKFDLWLRTDAVEGYHELMDGLSVKPIKEKGQPGVGLAHVRVGSNFRPKVTIKPDDSVEIIRLEQRWLYEYQLAASLHRQVRLGDVTVVVSKVDLTGSKWFRQDRGFTHALVMHEIWVHEVLGS